MDDNGVDNSVTSSSVEDNPASIDVDDNGEHGGGTDDSGDHGGGDA